MPGKSKSKKKTEQQEFAFLNIAESRNLPKDVVEEALSEAMEKAYQKQSGLKDLKVRTEINNGNMKVFRQRETVENVDDEEFEISLEDAKKVKPDAEIGDLIDEEVSLNNFDRAAITLAKSVIKTKIREAEKAVIYEKYVDQVGEMVEGIVESAEDRFILVLLGADKEGKHQNGSTLAMMKKNDQIPTEHYFDGEHIKVVITDVNKESKGAQILVSRADPVFIKRLFEKEVPEIYNGTIEIKAIARDPGMRAKIAVYSHNENIDPIGACIGPKGSRVQAIIQELNGEKIDIFEWSDDIQQLVANALSPAAGVVVIPKDGPRGGLIAVVPDNQLSLAIGKKGQNARLAVKLTNHRIDIKSQSEMKELGIDYQAIADEMHAEYEARKAAERAYKQQQRIDQLRAESPDVIDIDSVDFTYDDDDYVPESQKEAEQIPSAAPNANKEAPAENEKDVEEMEEAARIAKEKRKSLAERREQSYTSKFEPAAEAAPAQPSSKKNDHKHSYKNEKQEERKPVLKKKPAYTAMQPIYTEDELAEIEENELEEELSASWNEDVDYEEYDEYYDDEY
ncbi:transcription termination factor NusA [Ileibacterium valens]|uniref:transcription termination factor NusA n=2 Tax=Ileibacterium valens TaxID=1862668 RepID=UPI00259B3A0C|nr:transcription termination factor NusA [Ileibacterium valens]